MAVKVAQAIRVDGAMSILIRERLISFEMVKSIEEVCDFARQVDQKPTSLQLCAGCAATFKNKSGLVYQRTSCVDGCLINALRWQQDKCNTFVRDSRYEAGSEDEDYRLALSSTTCYQSRTQRNEPRTNITRMSL